MSPALDGAWRQAGRVAGSSMYTMQISRPRSEQLFKRADNADHCRLCKCGTLLLCECAWSTRVVGPNQRYERFRGSSVLMGPCNASACLHGSVQL